MPDFTRDWDKEPIGHRKSDLWLAFSWGIMAGSVITLVLQAAGV